MIEPAFARCVCKLSFHTLAYSQLSPFTFHLSVFQALVYVLLSNNQKRRGKFPALNSITPRGYPIGSLFYQRPAGRNLCLRCPRPFAKKLTDRSICGLLPQIDPFSMRALTRPARCDRRHTTRDQPRRASKEPLCVSTSFVGHLIKVDKAAFSHPARHDQCPCYARLTAGGFID